MATQVKRRPAANGVESPNRKIVVVNDKFGNKIGNQQGTTRIIFDAVQLGISPQKQTITLFENCSSRQFPLTNLPENKLQVGESITMQRIYFGIMSCATGTTDAQSVNPLEYFPQFFRLNAAQYAFSISQNQVLKKLPVASHSAPFNNMSTFGFQYLPLPDESHLIMQSVRHLSNNLVIPPDIEFKMEVTIPPLPGIPAGSDSYLVCYIEGLGSLFSPKATY